MEFITRDGGDHDVKWLVLVMVVIMIGIFTILAPMMHFSGDTCGDDGLLQITKPPPRVFLANNEIG